MLKITKKDIQRFWSKVEKTDTCWNWEKYLFNGYGFFKFQHKTIRAHRFAYSIQNGDIPNGLCVLHRCDNRKCVNGSHLFLGTYQDNHDDMILKGRDRHLSGEEHGRSKISMKDVIKIRKLSKKKYTQKKLADMFKISIANIYYIQRGLTWR